MRNKDGFPKTNVCYIDKEPKCANCHEQLRYGLYAYWYTKQMKFLCESCESIKDIEWIRFSTRKPVLLKVLEHENKEEKI